MSNMNSKTIVLDPNNPWNNPEDIMIAKFKGHEIGDLCVDGFSIMVVGDPRDVERERYALTAVGSKPSNEFKLTKPAIPAGLWMERNMEEWLDAAVDPAAVREGLTAAMRSFGDRPEEDRKITCTLKIEDGEHMQLTDKPFLGPDELTEELKIQPRHPLAFTDTEQFDADGAPLFNLQTAVVWLLCDMSTIREMPEEKLKVQRGVAMACDIKKRQRALAKVPVNQT